jgi:hypothetical protein
MGGGAGRHPRCRRDRREGTSVPQNRAAAANKTRIRARQLAVAVPALLRIALPGSMASSPAASRTVRPGSRTGPARRPPARQLKGTAGELASGANLAATGAANAPQVRKRSVQASARSVPPGTNSPTVPATDSRRRENRQRMSTSSSPQACTRLTAAPRNSPRGPSSCPPRWRPPPRATLRTTSRTAPSRFMAAQPSLPTEPASWRTARPSWRTARPSSGATGCQQ